jgi:hypothetical protein
VVHDLGDAGHADAADADEVDGADVGADRLHAARSCRRQGQRRLGRGLACRPWPEVSPPDQFDQVGKVARGIGPPDRQRPARGIGERLGFVGQRLDLQ